MWANLAVYVDLLRTFGDIFDGKFDGIFFFAKFWSIKIFIYINPRIAEKIIEIFALAF